ncbi:CAP domain-containing protein [Niabella ginsengisoli]|uniref:CAP domain-containing protein n=1 Tax=Niabella ginsengisoli TaxID=522298 RepID=A0ABS9SI83_9BACT|nr:CAP domain-containing protein [Niabella ginsengisoli]MCH5597874.1 CAP domain-containing protein [Niabella ginsengisoli]
MKFFASILFFSTLFLIQSCSSGQTSTGNSSVDPQDLLQAVNKIRSKGCKCGGTYMPPVKPLKWNTKLEKAASSHSAYMNNRKRLSHTGNKNSNPGTRISNAGYKWRFYAENIAMGQRTVSDVMNSWINSAGHCRNIMNKNATEMGAAKTGAYWTQVFAAPQ